MNVMDEFYLMDRIKERVSYVGAHAHTCDDTCDTEIPFFLTS